MGYVPVAYAVPGGSLLINIRGTVYPALVGKRRSSRQTRLMSRHRSPPLGLSDPGLLAVQSPPRPAHQYIRASDRARAASADPGMMTDRRRITKPHEQTSHCSQDYNAAGPVIRGVRGSRD